VAVAPAVVLLGLLAFARVKAQWAALWGLATVLTAAVFLYGMPGDLALAAAAYGAAYGFMPIGWIVLNVVFLYDVTVATRQFDVVRQSIAHVTDDRRIQALLIAFGFGAFIEGAAGFGAPVAISTAMLVGLGFRPLLAALLSLIGNTAPVAFGALGTPIMALAQVTGLPVMQLSTMVGRQLPPFCLVIPFGLVIAMAGWRGAIEVWPACLVSGFSFGLTQFLVSNLHGPWLVDTAAALTAMGSLLLLLQFWRPRNCWRFAEDVSDISNATIVTRHVLVRAWLPWVLLTALVFIWALPGTKSALSGFGEVRLAVPRLDQAVIKVPPLVETPKPETAVYSFNLPAATGTAPLLAAVAAGLLLCQTPMALARLYGRTFVRVLPSLLTIMGMLALAYVSRYAGLDSTLGLVLANTGPMFPFFAPMLGWIGVALTGSDTASNVLFGNLQQVTAHQLGVSPVLAAAANSTGGVMGKMIDAQSIVVAGLATGETGNEAQIFRRIFWLSFGMAALVGLFICAQAYLFPGIVPD
jgi:lactate permease